MNLNYRLRLVTAAFLLLGFASSAQNSSVSIGTSNTNASAVLWLNSPGQNQGFIIPVGSRTNVATPVKGMLIFDTNEVYAYDGTNWNTVGGSSGSGSTYSLSYNASTKVISLNPNASGTATIDISTTALSGGDLSGTLGTPSVSGILGKSITLPSSGVQYLSYDVTQAKWVFQTPSGTGDMLKATYDPTNKNADAFDLTKHAGILPIANGGTGASTAATALTNLGALNNPMNAAGDIIYGGIAGVPTKLATGTGFLKGGVIPGYAAVNLASTDVSGILPFAKGGTGLALGVAPANGQVYMGNGAGFTVGTLTAGTNISVVNGAGSITINSTALANPMTSAGDIIYGGVAGVATRLAGGATGVLKSNGTTPSWGTIVDADINSSGITTAGKVSGSAITSGTIGGSTVINTSGDIITTTGKLSIGGTTTFGSHTYTWPIAALAASNTFLSTDGSGNLSWTTTPSPFSTNNVIPKGNGSGLTSSLLFDDGTNVGIGTAAPAYALEVKGNIVNSNPSQGYLGLTGDLPGFGTGVYPTLKTSYTNMYFSVGGKYSGYLGGTDAALGLNNSTSLQKVILNTNGDSYFTGGNVGIGTSTPGSLLEVNGNTTVSGFTQLGSSSPSIKVAYFSGTTAATVGAFKDFPLGSITTDKIISVSVMVDWSGANEWIQPGWTNSAGYSFNWLIASGNVRVVNNDMPSANPPLTSGAIIGKAVRVVVIYIP